MSMHNLEMYEKFISFQKRDALQCLQKFKSKMNWQQNASVIDLGSGDGFVTAHILKKQLPADFKKLVGVDVSKEMVDYANAKYSDDKTSFVQMDISRVVPRDLVGAFDHAFSSYMIQSLRYNVLWIQFVHDQETTFKNIYEVLKEGGSCLVLFLGHTLLYDPYIELAKLEKWREWLKDIDKFVSRYYYLDDPSTEVRRLMQEAGFHDIHIEANKASFKYESYDCLCNMVESGNLFHLPPDTLKEFMKDFKTVCEKYVEKVDGKSTIILKYTQIVGFGSK